jgi:hypothetical protein
MDDVKHDKEVIILVAAILLLPKIKELGEFKDSPKLRCAVADAVRMAKFIARHIESGSF